MEKLGISNDELKRELMHELAHLFERRTSLVKEGSEYTEDMKKLQVRIDAIKARLSTLEGQSE